MIYMNVGEIKELVSKSGLFVGDADIDEDNNLANVYVEVNAVEIYST